MAHPCPECGLRCHCGGDIDDCEFEGTPEHRGCLHCFAFDPYEDEQEEHDCGEDTCVCLDTD